MVYVRAPPRAMDKVLPHPKIFVLPCSINDVADVAHRWNENRFMQQIKIA